MNKYNKLIILLMVFAVVFCFSAIGGVSAAGTGNNTTLNANNITNVTGLGNTAWPKYQSNSNNTGQSPYIGPQTNTTEYTYTTANTMTQNDNLAIGADGTIYFGIRSTDYLYAMTSDGIIKWKAATSKPVFATAIGANGIIYAGTASGSSPYSLYAFYPNGTQEWAYGNITKNIRGIAIGPDGSIYFGCDDDNLYALSPNGTLEWKYTTGAPIYAFPAIGSNGTIYFGSTDKNVYALNPNGTFEWSYPTQAAIDSSPSIGPDGTIYVGSDQLYALNPNGTLKWTYPTSSISYSSPAIGSGTIYIGNTNGILYAINSTNGALEWTYNAGSTIWDAPIIGADGTIYFGSNNLYALNPNGTLKWQYALSNTIYNLAMDAYSTLYVANGGNLLYAFQDPTPEADFTANPTNGTVPLNVQFTDQSTGGIISYQWNFGDGNTSTLENPTHTYTTIGSYNVTETVTGTQGNDTLTENNYIIVTAPKALVANFTANSTNDTAPLNVQFTDESSGTPTSWLWNFGDGTNSTLQNPTHIYTTPGIYNVTETVSNSVGNNTLTENNYINVKYPAPVAGFTANNTNGTVPLSVQFTDQSTGNVTGYSWNFGDGYTSTLQNPTHTYTTPGIYNVTETVTGPGGNNTLTRTGYITVLFNTLNVSCITPTNGTVNVASNQTITITFNEPIQAGGALDAITVTGQDGIARYITKTIQNNTITITPTDNWTPGITFTTYIPANAVTDQYGNKLNTTYTSTFTTEQNPTITSIYPVNGSNVADNQNITLTFNEPIQAGGALDAITVTRQDGIAQYITKTINGNTLTITPTDNWTVESIFTIYIPVNAVIDQYGNKLNTTYTSTFNTEQNPTITSIYPVNGTSNVADNQNITLTFNEPIQAGGALDAITVTGQDGIARYITKTIQNNTLTITPTDNWNLGTTYTIQIPANAVTDQYGNKLNTTYTSNFTTGQSPVIISVVPVNGTSNVASNQTITLTFNEPIQAGGALDAITVTGQNGVASYITKTINGNTLTITPTDNWNLGTTYTIQIPANAVTDQYGNPLSTVYTSNFTAGQTLTVTSVVPVNGTSNVASNQTITLTFNEPIQAGGALDAITVTGQNGVASYITKTINGNTLTITPIDNWIPGTKYTINIPAYAVTDQNGNTLTTPYISTFTISS